MSENGVLWKLIVHFFFRDHARPVEWLSMLWLGGWAQLLFDNPAVFREPRYIGFSGLEPETWATIMAVVVVVQFAAMWPSRFSQLLRFLAMLVAAGLWAVIAVVFWLTADVVPIGIRIFGVFAPFAALTAVYLGVPLGWPKQKS